MIDISSRRELLADLALIDRRSAGCRHVLHSPTPRELVEGIGDDEGRIYRYMSVFKDTDHYRMYYACPKVTHEGGEKRRLPERICLATSHDGIHWERADLRLFPLPELKVNPVVWIEDGVERFGVGGFSPFLDTNPACPPEERYKAVAEAGPAGKAAKGANGLFILGSADGIHWRNLSPELAITGGPGRGAFDSQNLAFWDSVRGEYRLYRREVFLEGPHTAFRDVLTATSADFRSWSEPQRLRYPGALPEQLYTNNILPYPRAPHLFLGFPVRYVLRPWSPAIAALPERERREELIRNSGAEPNADDPTGAGGVRIGTSLTDVLFMASRDGLTFHRAPSAFLRPGLRMKDNWFYPDNYPAWGMLATPSAIEGAPEELSFYVSEGGRRPGQPNQCRRYTLRMDGFASLQADAFGGEAVTHPLRFSGRRLFVNFSASAAGSVRVELLDATGWPLPGFSAELLGDDLDRPVEWEGGADLSAVEGQPIRLRWVLHEADLFAFRFGNEP